MYQLVFKGECVDGTDPQTARNNARSLFKASVEQVERMFSGQPVVIRNRLEEDQAEKYRAVLRKHGMIAYVQPMAVAGQQGEAARTAAPPAPKTNEAVAPTPAPGTQPPPPPAAEQPAEPAEPVRQGEAPTVEPGDRLPVAGEKVDSILAGSGLSLDPVGVTLEEHEEVEAPMFQHLDEWDLAPPGSDLGVKRDLPPPVVPDVSHLSLADEEPNRKRDA